MYISINGTHVPHSFDIHNPSKLYTKESDGTLVAYNGSEIENEAYINQITEGIMDTLRQERTEEAAKLRENQEKILALMPEYTEAWKIYTEMLRLKTVNSNRRWYQLSNKARRNELLLQLSLIAAKVDPVNFYANSYRRHAQQYLHAIEGKVLRSLQANLKDTPTRDMIKATLMTVPNLKSKSFDELLNLFK